MSKVRETVIDRIDGDIVTAGNIEKLQYNQVIQKGAKLLQRGEVVAFPTETVYGLGADATRGESVKKIFEAKGRPQDNPLIVHIASQDWLSDLVRDSIPTVGQKLIEAFWPGPLTIIVNKSSYIPDQTTAGLDSVAVRMPSHPVALAIIRKSSLPIAAPSANSSGYPSPTRAKHVYDDLQGKISYIIDGGSCPVGVESTVIDIRDKTPKILRPGGITREEINEVLDSSCSRINKGYATNSSVGNLVENNNQNEKDNFSEKEEKNNVPLSPGMKYRHYSPVTPLKLIKKSDLDRIDKLLEEYKSKYRFKKVILVVTDETARQSNNLSLTEYIEMGSVNDLRKIAHNLFAILRRVDREELDLILVESIPEKGLGEAIMNRLHKAAGDNIHFD